MVESTWKVVCQCGKLSSEGFGYRASFLETTPCFKRRWWNFWRHRKNIIYIIDANDNWKYHTTRTQDPHRY